MIPQPFSDRRHGLRADVDPAARPADALDARDHGTIFPVELELDHKLLPAPWEAFTFFDSLR